MGHCAETTAASYISSKIINSGMRWAGHVAHIGKKRTAYRSSVGKAEGKRPLEKSRRRWQYNNVII
jgi:hypothetical protein